MLVQDKYSREAEAMRAQHQAATEEAVGRQQQALAQSSKALEDAQAALRESQVLVPACARFWAPELQDFCEPELVSHEGASAAGQHRH